MDMSKERAADCKWKNYIPPWIVRSLALDMFKPSPDHNMTEL